MSDSRDGPKRARSFGPQVGGSDSEWAKLSQTALTNPELAWLRLLDVVAWTDDAGLFWVADIVEDLVTWSPPTFVPRIEAEAERNPRFRRALLELVPTAGSEEFDRRLLALRETIAREAANASRGIRRR